MILLNAVARTGGQVVLTLAYSTDGGTVILDLDAEQVIDRLKQLRALVGRKPTPQEAREVVVQLINEIRAGGEPLVDVIAWEAFIGVDLEG
jgi:hypothetical protein